MVNTCQAQREHHSANGIRLQADQVVSCVGGVRQGGLRSEGQIRTRSRGPSSRLAGWEGLAADLAGSGQGVGHRNHTYEGAPAAWSLVSLASGLVDGSRGESMGMGSSFAKGSNGNPAEIMTSKVTERSEEDSG